MSPATFDYHLLTGSQAINAGSSTVSAFVPNDLDLNTRPQGGSYDIGCYEFLQGNSNSEITGFENSVSVYPNPFSESAVLRITNFGELRIVDFKIYDVVGNEVYPETIRNSDSFVLRSGGLTNGIYFLKVGNTTKKIVVSR